MARMKLFPRTTTKTPATPAPGTKDRADSAKPAKVTGPGSRGWTGRGGGMAALVPSVKEYRGTTVQVCGLWPFSAGASSPDDWCAVGPA